MSKKRKIERSNGTFNPTKGYKELADELVRIRNDYFPDWTDGANWKIVAHQGTAFCDRENRTIKIRPDTSWSLAVLIIHEIAHAVTVDDHGPRWQARLRDAAKRAKEIGQDDLAQELEMQLDILSLPASSDVQSDEVYYLVEVAEGEQPALDLSASRRCRRAGVCPDADRIRGCVSRNAGGV